MVLTLPLVKLVQSTLSGKMARDLIFGILKKVVIIILSLDTRQALLKCLFCI